MYPFFISFCSGVLVLLVTIYPTGCPSVVALNVQLSTVLSLPGHLLSFSKDLGNCRQPHQQKSNLSKCICKQESCLKMPTWCQPQIFVNCSFLAASNKQSPLHQQVLQSLWLSKCQVMGGCQWGSITVILGVSVAGGYFSDSSLSGIYLTLVLSYCLVAYCICGLDVDIIKMIERTGFSSMFNWIQRVHYVNKV